MRASGLEDYVAWIEADGGAAMDVRGVADVLGAALLLSLMTGRNDVESEAVPVTSAAMAAEGDGAQQQFIEQAEFFRRKINLPTRAWTDIWQDQHNTSFVVAGAMRDELLSDLRLAVDTAVADGMSLDNFRNLFDAVVDKHGWNYNGGRNWRTRVIYETNIRTSYAAGRWQQLQAVKSRRPYWRYRHSPASVEPREHHLAWDGMVLHADDPWWHTNYPPNGWGCKCFVQALSERDLKRMGKSAPDKAPSLNEHTVTVGRGARTVTVPEGVDPGFAYAPGREQSLGGAVDRRLHAALEQPAKVGAKGVHEMLARPDVMQALENNWDTWRNAERTRGDSAEAFILGAMSESVVDKLKTNYGVQVQSAPVTIARREYGHADRAKKRERGAALDDEDWARLPEIIKSPRAVLYDNDRPGEILYVLDPVNDDGKGKIVVAVNYKEKLKFGENKRRIVISNSIRTTGYVKAYNLKSPKYTLIEGEIE